MKNNFFKIALANVLLTAVLVSLSCTDVPQNTNAVNAPANKTVAQSNDNRAVADVLDEDCSGDPSVKKTKIKDGIKKWIDKENNLKYQYKTKFDYEPVVESNGDAVLYIWGNLFSDAKDLNQLNKTYEGFVKKGCVTRVVFDKAPGAELLNPGFEFDLCEAPNQVCSNGTCQQVCPKDTGNGNSNTNTTANKPN